MTSVKKSSMVSPKLTLKGVINLQYSPNNFIENFIKL